jgi:hypothetical protein
VSTPSGWPSWTTPAGGRSPASLAGVGALLRFALADARTHLAEPILAGSSLALLTAMAGAGILLTERLAVTYDRALDAGPSLVIQRVDDGGNPLPIAEDEALAALGEVRGVTRAAGCRRSGSSAPPAVVDELEVDVFHSEEELAILPDLTAALRWPARVATREQARTAFRGRIARRGSLMTITLLPAVLALAALVLVAGRGRADRRYEIGLLKALGWTTADIARAQLLRAAVVGLPAIGVGILAAGAIALWPGSAVARELVLGAADVPLAPLPASTAVIALLAVVASVAAPWLAAALWPVLRGATADPADLLDEGSP